MTKKNYSKYEAKEELVTLSFNHVLLHKKDTKIYQVIFLSLLKYLSKLPQFGIKKKVRNLVVSNIFRIFVVVNQIVTNNIKRLPNDYQGQSYRNILYYR